MPSIKAFENLLLTVKLIFYQTGSCAKATYKQVFSTTYVYIQESTGFSI